MAVSPGQLTSADDERAPVVSDINDKMFILNMHTLNSMEQIRIISSKPAQEEG